MNTSYELLKYKPSFEDLRTTGEMIAELTECRFAYIEEIAHGLVFADGAENLPREITNEDFISDYAAASQALRASANRKSTPKRTAPFMDVMEKMSQTADLSYLCASICKKAAEAGKKPEASMFFSAENYPVNSKIAYVRNGYSDDAYSVFSDIIPNSSVVYHGNFAAVCEEVYYGRTGYCILPYETSAEGSLSGFRKLIRKYELAPVLTCSVQSGNASQGVQSITKFVLLSRGCIPQLKIPSQTDSQKNIRVTLDNPESAVQTKVYLCAMLTGMEFAKTESVPVSWDGDRYSTVMNFRVTEADPCPFLLYLRMEVQECSEICIYSDVRTRQE